MNAPTAPLMARPALWRLARQRVLAAAWTALGALGLLAFYGAMAPAHAGEVPGVRAEYYNWSGNGQPTMPITTATVDRTESNISIYQSSTAPAPGIGADNYLTRYTGTILIPTTGAYTFQVETDDGSRFYLDCDRDGTFINTELIIDRWSDSSSAAYTGACASNLIGGMRYAFKYEFYERGALATTRLSWTGPSPLTSTMTVIPRGDGTQGLYSGVYETTPPTITSTTLPCGANGLVYVAFSEQIDPTTAQTAANYTLPGGPVATQAVVLSDGVTVAVTVSPPISGNTTLTVNNVTDIAGNPIAANSSSSISFATVAVNAGLYGTYYDQNNGSTAALTGTSYTRIDSTINFDWGNGAPGVTGIGVDNFSVRWTGLLLVPTSGSYTLRTRSDDGVRLYINGSRIISNWTGHGATYDTASAMTFSAGTYMPLTLEYFDSGGGALIMLEWKVPGSANFVTVPASQLFYCAPSNLGSIAISASAGSASTCAPKTMTVTARDSGGTTLSNYTGTVTLTASNGRGDWSLGSSPTPAGTLNNGTANDGIGTYTFVASDAGVARLQLAESLAQTLTVTAADTAVAAATTGTTAAISFYDNAFSFSEDASNLVTGSDVAVAGRPHDYKISLLKKDPSTGSCGIATDYTGSRTLKFWRTDSNGSWTAPTVVSPALNIPGAQPASNNLTLSFSSGIASFNLGSTDIGSYAFNVLDDSFSGASSNVSGTSNLLTVRPFAIVVQAIKQGSTNNPGGSLATDTVYAKAGSSFQATVGAYKWAAAMTSNGTDANNDGLPDAGATLANTIAGGLASAYTSTVTLSPLAGSQTPAAGVLGTLNNGAVSSYSGGSATVSTLQYTEAGSFALNTTSVVSNFLGSGMSLNATVFNAAGAQANRIGRFTPARFAVSNGSVTHRPNASCSPASAYTYLSENFQLGFTLTAQNALGATTLNYTGSYARLDPSLASAWQLAGIDGSTRFISTGGTPRLSIGSASGSWSNGVASGITLSAAALRATTADGPFSASFGIAPVDSDGVLMGSYDLDTDIPTNGTDHTTVASVALRFGRLRLMNGVGSQDRPLGLQVAAQYWNGSTFADNTLDSCTRIAATAVNFGNYRKGMTAADSAMNGSALTLASGRATLMLARPISGHTGSYDVALSLGSTATDASCLQSWTPGAGDAATVGANLSFLRGAWCSSTYDKDPSARASFGLYRGSDNLIYQRENY